MSSDLFRNPLTFLDLPHSTAFADADVTILGIPFDCGRDPTRFGPRQGPNAVRHASILTRELMQDADPFPLDSITVTDAGNVNLLPGDIDLAFSRIEAAMDAILCADCIPVTVGGDGSVSLPQMRSLHRKYGAFALLHFDAHTDTWPVPASNQHNNANQFTFASTEELVDMRAALHIGTRGPVNARKNIDYAESLGYRVIPFNEYRAMGQQELLSLINNVVGEKPVFVCYDMDFFDPSVAPGVATPTPGGAMPEEGLALMRGLKGLNIIGIDINTVTPVHDAGGSTAILAASLLAECLGILS